MAFNRRPHSRRLWLGLCEVSVGITASGALCHVPGMKGGQRRKLSVSRRSRRTRRRICHPGEWHMHALAGIINSPEYMLRDEEKAHVDYSAPSISIQCVRHAMMYESVSSARRALARSLTQSIIQYWDTHMPAVWADSTRVGLRACVYFWRRIILRWIFPGRLGKSSLMLIDSRQMDVDDFWASAWLSQQFCLHLVVFASQMRKSKQIFSIDLLRFGGKILMFWVKARQSS